MSAHTPGPWVRTEAPRNTNAAFTIYGSTQLKFPVADVLRTAYADDNARLIAAAPDLLAALEAFTKHDDFLGWHPRYDDAVKLARDAIRKATGAAP